MNPQLQKVWSIIPANWQPEMQRVYEQAKEFIVHEPNEGQRVVMSMIVTNVDFDKLVAEKDVFAHFVTELKQAIALTAGEHVEPTSVDIKLTKAGQGVRVESTVNLPAHLSTKAVGYIRDAL